MRFALMIEPQQGLGYGDQVAIAKRAEANGFEALFRSDHYASFPGATGQPTTDAWTVIAGLARETDRLSLGALVSPVTFRHAGTFAKIVTTADEMSGGRIEVGVGAGWNDLEHRQLGLPFPGLGERMDAVEDQLAVLHGLWGEPDGWSYDGKTVTIRDALFYPKPVEVPGRPTGKNGLARPSIIFGGSGAPRGARLTASMVRRVQHAGEPGDGRGGVRQGGCRVRGDRPRSRHARALGDDRRPRRTDRRRGPRSGAARCSTRSATTPAATSGSRSAATAGSTGRATRPAP